MVERGGKSTFTDQVFITVNGLPKGIRIIDNKKVFHKKSKKYYIDRALARTWYLQYCITSCFFST